MEATTENTTENKRKRRPSTNLPDHVLNDIFDAHPVRFLLTRVCGVSEEWSALGNRLFNINCRTAFGFTMPEYLSSPHSDYSGFANERTSLHSLYERFARAKKLLLGILETPSAGGIEIVTSGMMLSLTSDVDNLLFQSTWFSRGLPRLPDVDALVSPVLPVPFGALWIAQMNPERDPDAQEAPRHDRFNLGVEFATSNSKFWRGIVRHAAEVFCKRFRDIPAERNDARDMQRILREVSVRMQELDSHKAMDVDPTMALFLAEERSPNECKETIPHAWRAYPKCSQTDLKAASRIARPTMHQMITSDQTYSMRYRGTWVGTAIFTDERGVDRSEYPHTRVEMEEVFRTFEGHVVVSNDGEEWRIVVLEMCRPSIASRRHSWTVLIVKNREILREIHSPGQVESPPPVKSFWGIRADVFTDTLECGSEPIEHNRVVRMMDAISPRMTFVGTLDYTSTL
jgi:hypothetical protein